MGKNEERESHWVRWALRTARHWSDIENDIRRMEVEAIDSDHRRLTELTLELSGLLGFGDERVLDLKKIEQQGKVLETIYTFSEFHFRREEDMIRRFDLPYAEQQFRQHEKFLSMLRETLEEFKKGRLTISMNLNNWVLDWWVSHINQLDYLTFRQDNWFSRVIDQADSWASLAAIVHPTHVSDVDAEHRQLAELALDIISRLRSGGTLEVGQFDRIIAASEAHFHHEEAIIRTYGLPALALQEQQHAFMLSAFREYREKLVAGTLDKPGEVTGMILNWWVTHINDTDQVSFAGSEIDTLVCGDAKSWAEFQRFVPVLGVEAVDQDHQDITQQFLKIEPLVQESRRAELSGDAAMMEASRERWLALLHDIEEAARRHFVREDLLMDRIGTQIAPVHRTEHARFLEILASYQGDLRAGRINLSSSIQQFLLTWWLRHINEMDAPSFQALSAGSPVDAPLPAALANAVQLKVESQA